MCIDTLLSAQAWMAQVAAISDELVKALGDRYPRREAELRLERAWCELHLRDLWGPWSREGDRWNSWLQDDIRQAKELAAALAREVGDSQLPQRLLDRNPRLAALDLPA